MVKLLCMQTDKGSHFMSTADRFIELRKRYIESQYGRLNKEQLQAALTGKGAVLVLDRKSVV